MIKSNLLLISILTVAAPIDAAGPVPMSLSPAIGNTLHYRGADGKFEMFIYDDADGGYEAVVAPPGAPPMHMSGRWKVVGAQICRDQKQPAPPADRATICEPFATYPTLDRPGSLMNGALAITLLKGRALPN